MGCEILGVLIARVSGQSLGAFLRERIFEPEAKLDRLPTWDRQGVFLRDHRAS